MQVLAFFLAVVALAIFIADYFRSHGLVALGLAFVTAAWMAELVIQNGSTIVVR